MMLPRHRPALSTAPLRHALSSLRIRRWLGLVQGRSLASQSNNAAAEFRCSGADPGGAKPEDLHPHLAQAAQQQQQQQCRKISSPTPRVKKKKKKKKASAWNSLIHGCVAAGEAREALGLYQRMKEEFLQPDASAFVSLLKACAEVRDIGIASELHGDLWRKGLVGSDAFVASALVAMYARCGLLVRALDALEEMPIRSVVSWNAMISGYASNGRCSEALDCMELMRMEGISPSAVTFTCALKSCAAIGALGRGLELHREIGRRRLLDKDRVLGGALVDMYAELGMVSAAQEAFDGLPLRGPVAWNALIVAYTKSGSAERALKCFDKMRSEGVCPDAVAYASAVKACADGGAVERGCGLHAEIERAGLSGRDLVLDSALLGMYAKCGRLEKARKIFDGLQVRDAVCWTALIAGYAQEERSEEALKCFELMKRDGVSPDVVAFVWSVKACGAIGAVHKGNEIYDEIRRKGLLGTQHLAVDNALLDMYTRFGLLGKAREVFDGIAQPDVVSWNTLMMGYGKQNRGEEVLRCFEKMRLAGVEPDAVTFACGLKACGSTGALAKGREIHREADRNGLLTTDLAVCNSAIDMYAKCGVPVKAQEAFDKLPFRDLLSWNALLAAYAQAGDAGNVFAAFERMKQDDMKPDSATFTHLLTACSHAGLVDLAQMHFSSMAHDYGIIPNAEQHTCFVDLLGRAGQLEKAVEIMIKLPFHPDSAMWCTILGACRKWGDVMLAEQAFEYAVRAEERGSAAYVCMSNIYADANMHGDAKRIEELRVKKQAWKKPGNAWWCDDDAQEGAQKVEELQKQKKEWRMLLLD